MKNIAIAILALVLCVTASVGAPLIPVQVRSRMKLPPFHYFTETRVFAAKQRACVIAIGLGKTHMGLYIYDVHGNCIGLDDIGTSGTRDDMAAVWYPPQTVPYSLEVRNLGLMTNAFELAVR